MIQCGHLFPASYGASGEAANIAVPGFSRCNKTSTASGRTGLRGRARPVDSEAHRRAADKVSRFQEVLGGVVGPKSL